VKCMICRSGWIVVGHSEIVSARVANEQEHNFERNVLQREVFKNSASPHSRERVGVESIHHGHHPFWAIIF
jgi:hypothetical protein